ncbi:alpha/beta hydrolase fold domain-containing protein [Streptobacillus moniliformis]|uniref:Alpha/beta hydrolase fold-3 domain protein n=3 Tax=Streptobacillus moniliformis TaxID=34105 RepID=D1AUV9_STRM9|nr:alpha/beta hydrolase fold domain-containing protein [Streptobacillus moniliformis]ACZ01519.1 Alpha/beta hydrolase fold-3 domain protein [Streptobacillus moniliformis DSM 12112]AVL43481.1 steryl acetyl hydrolase [Streptobacillus moniliformis]SQA13317.1 Monoterpene epsilon-lactone hydrolase [Streptobacillus moniliformis]
MLNKMFKGIITISTLFLISCSNIELPENVSGRSKIYSMLSYNLSPKINRDSMYALLTSVGLEIEDYVVPEEFDLRVYDEDNTRIEQYYTKNNLEKKLIIIGNGGSFLNPYKIARRDFYLNFSKKLQGFDVMIVDLHMGFQHRFPIQNKDFLNAYRLALKLGYSHNKITFIGDSSGGNIVTTSTIYLRDNNLPLPAGIFLMSPFLDATNMVESRERNRKKDVLFGNPYNFKNRLKMLENIPYFIAEKDKTNRYISPVYAKNLKGFPKTLIHVSDYEILQDDSVVFYNNLKKSGVDATLVEYPGQLHVFQMLDIREAEDSIDKATKFLNEITRDKKHIKIDKKIIEKIKFEVKTDKYREEEIKEFFKKIDINIDRLIEFEQYNYKTSNRNYLNKK